MLNDSTNNTILFDQAKWKNDELVNQQPFTRLQMIDDLRSNYLPKGLSREHLIELLGSPESEKYFTDYNLVYWLGPEQGLIQVDSKWLGIKLDDSGLLSYHELLTD